MNRFLSKPRRGGAANAHVTVSRTRGPAAAPGPRALAAAGARGRRRPRRRRRRLRLRVGRHCLRTAARSTSSATRLPRRPTPTTSSPASTRPPTVRASSSRTRSAPRATSRARSRPASRPTSCTSRFEPDMQRLVDAGLVADDWDSEPVRGHRRGLGCCLRRPQGQPGQHPDLGRPDPAGRRGADAEPVHLGRRALEPDGRLRQRGAHRGQEP